MPKTQPPTPLRRSMLVRLKGGDPKEVSAVRVVSADGKHVALEKTLGGESRHSVNDLEVVFDITDGPTVGKHVVAELNKLAGKERFVLDADSDHSILDSTSSVRVELTRQRGYGYMAPGTWNERPISGLQLHRHHQFSRSVPGIFSIDLTGKFGAAKLLAKVDQVARELAVGEQAEKDALERHRQAERQREVAMGVLDGIFKEHGLRFKITGSNARAVTLANGAVVEFMHEHGEVRVHRIDGIDLGTPANVRILLAAVAQM